MANDPSGNDPKDIWQQQSREMSTVRLERMIRRRAQELRARTGRELVGTIVSPAIVVSISSFGIARGDNPMQRAAFAIATAWSVAGAFVMNRGMWSGMRTEDGTSATGLAFYRREIERRRYLFHRVMQWSFAPVVLAIGALIAWLRERGPVAKMIPFLTLVTIWIAAAVVMHRTRREDLQREIDELNDIEKENKP